MKKLILESFLFLTWLLPLLFLVYLAFIFIFFTLFPDFPIGINLKEILALTNEQFARILVFLLGLACVGMFLKMRKAKQKLILFKFKSKIDFLVTLTTSFFFSTFFIKTFFNFPQIEAILIVFLTLFFFSLIPNLVTFFVNPNFSFFKNLIAVSNLKILYFYTKKLQPNLVIDFFKACLIVFITIVFFLFILVFSFWALVNLSTYGQYKIILLLLLAFIWFLYGYLIRVYILKIFYSFRNFIKKAAQKKEVLLKVRSLFLDVLKTLMIGGGILAFFTIIVIILAWQLNRYAQYQKHLRENLTITSVAPVKTTMAQKVAIRGFNFGWRLGEKDSLMSSFGPVVVDEWKGEEIIFTVPLHWKEGTVMLWIVRTKNDQPKGDLIKSNTVSLEIMSRWDFFPAEEELKSKDIVSYFKRGIKKIRRTLFLKKPYFP